MAEQYEQWLHQLNEDFVASTTASLDIEEAFTIVMRRAARHGRNTGQARVKRVHTGINGDRTDTVADPMRAPIVARRLTTKERAIASLAAHGLSEREIAQRLVMSVRAVKTHLERVHTKLGIFANGTDPSGVPATAGTPPAQPRTRAKDDL